jgi:hypothetical protein
MHPLGDGRIVANLDHIEVVYQRIKANAAM